ncbi:MAG: ADP-ribosylation factor-like protein [Candidatus Helarchaeota archaeon]
MEGIKEDKKNENKNENKKEETDAIEALKEKIDKINSNSEDKKKKNIESATLNSSSEEKSSEENEITKEADRDKDLSSDKVEVQNSETKDLKSESKKLPSEKLKVKEKKDTLKKLKTKDSEIHGPDIVELQPQSQENHTKIEETLKEFEDTIVISKTKLATPLEIQNLLVNLPEDLEKEQILDLPITHIKGLSAALAKQLETTLDIKKISDFCNKFVPKEKLALLNILQITEDEVEKWQAVANYIVKVVKGDVEVTEKKKILLAGLDNAGKTAIINVLTKRFNIASLKPTKHVDVTPLTTDTVIFSIWDMGGQDQYRKIYLSHPERFFINIYTVIFVVDVQDNKRYKLSLSYLEKILNILQSFSEFPDVMVFLHKADPDIYEKIQPELKMLENKFQNLCKTYNFVHRILHTSIYNTILTESNVLDSLSNLFECSQNRESSPELLKSLQAVYDNFISLSYVIEEKFQYLESRLNNLEAQNRHMFNQLTSEKPAPATYGSIPAKIGQNPPEKQPLSPIAARQALNAELKKLFRRRYQT